MLTLKEIEDRILHRLQDGRGKLIGRISKSEISPCPVCKYGPWCHPTCPLRYV